MSAKKSGRLGARDSPDRLVCRRIAGARVKTRVRRISREAPLLYADIDESQVNDSGGNDIDSFRLGHYVIHINKIRIAEITGLDASKFYFSSFEEDRALLSERSDTQKRNLWGAQIHLRRLDRFILLINFVKHLTEDNLLGSRRFIDLYLPSALDFRMSILDTVAHETRHVIQEKFSMYTDRHPLVLFLIRVAKKVGLSLRFYEFSAVERDARSFASNARKDPRWLECVQVEEIPVN